MRSRWLTPAVTSAAVIVGLAVVFDWAGLRLVLAASICLLLPGWGWAQRFRTRDLGDTLALALTLSICATVVVSTAMVMTAHWSTLGGLSALVAVGAAGFVPTQSVLARISETFSAKAVPVGAHADPEWVDWYRQRRTHADIEQQQAESEWVDWYADARRRAAEERARARAWQREADEQWAEWFRTTHPERVGRQESSSSKSTSKS